MAIYQHPDRSTRMEVPHGFGYDEGLPPLRKQPATPRQFARGGIPFRSLLIAVLLVNGLAWWGSKKVNEQRSEWLSAAAHRHGAPVASTNPVVSPAPTEAPSAVDSASHTDPQAVMDPAYVVDPANAVNPANKLNLLDDTVPVKQGTMR